MIDVIKGLIQAKKVIAVHAVTVEIKRDHSMPSVVGDDGSMFVPERLTVQWVKSEFDADWRCTQVIAYGFRCNDRRGVSGLGRQEWRDSRDESIPLWIGLMIDLTEPESWLGK